MGAVYVALEKAGIPNTEARGARRESREGRIVGVIVEGVSGCGSEEVRR